MSRKIFVSVLAVFILVLAVGYMRNGQTLGLPFDLIRTADGEVMTETLEISADEVLEAFKGTGDSTGNMHLDILSSFNTQKNPVDFIQLSHEGYFYDESISVEIAFTLDGVSEYEIYYTNDGSEPSKDKTPYTKPIDIFANQVKVPGYCLKVKVYYTQNGESLETTTLTHTYFVSTLVENRFDTLIYSISTDPYNLYDYEYGILIEGKLRDDFKKNNPKRDIIPPDPANYNLRGIAGERPVYVEVFEPDGTRVLAQGAGVRVHGNWSRANAQKSLRLVAKKIYEPLLNLGKFHYNLFEDAVTVAEYPNKAGLYEFDAIVLRNSANDNGFAYLRNELTATLARIAGFPNTSWVRPASVYVNGNYYGFAWMNQIFDLDYLQLTFQAPDDNFAILDFGEDSITNNWFGISDGAESAYNDFQRVSQLVNNGLTNDRNYEEFCELVDIDNLVMYYAIQCYIDNRDWPRGNMKIWKYCGESDGSNEYLDGKFRFLLYDGEFAWGLYDNSYSNNTLRRLLGVGDTNNGGASKLLTELMKRDDFVQKFTTVICDLANDAFSAQTASKTIDDLARASQKELTAAFRELPYYYGNYSATTGPRGTVRSFATNRPATMYTHLRSHFKLTNTYTVTVKGADGMRTSLNTMLINGAETKSSVYFVEHSVVLKTFEESNAYNFKHWLVNGEIVTDKEIVISADMCEDGKIEIELVSEAVERSPLMIRQLYAGGDSDWIIIYNTSDMPVKTDGLYLTDNLNKPQKWAFPTMTIEPFGELLLICTNNKHLSTLMNVAVNFNMGTGEILFMSDENGTKLSQVGIPSMKETELLSYDFDQGVYRIMPYSSKY